METELSGQQRKTAEKMKAEEKMKAAEERSSLATVKQRVG